MATMARRVTKFAVRRKLLPVVSLLGSEKFPDGSSREITLQRIEIVAALSAGSHEISHFSAKFPVLSHFAGEFSSGDMFDLDCIHRQRALKSL
jgi:hypothetical protein